MEERVLESLYTILLLLHIKAKIKVYRVRTAKLI